MKAPWRGFHELDIDEPFEEVSFAMENYEDIDMDVDDFIEDISYVREDCEGIFE